MSKDNLGDRMKTYENVTRTYLTRRTPVIIRIDGKAFHTFTRGFVKPFDNVLVKTMQDTMKYLCENIEGCVLGYTQSDEITLVLCDYKKLTSAAWFDNNILKMCSVSASLATVAFNAFFPVNAREFSDENADISKSPYWDKKLQLSDKTAGFKIATFDSRVFNIPKEEVANCLLWRQQDATRNSIQAVAQANFPHKLLQGKNTNELQELLWQEKNINWNDTPTHLKRGSCCIKVKEETVINGNNVTRSKWIIDNEIPIFSQDRDYVENRIVFED